MSSSHIGGGSGLISVDMFTVAHRERAAATSVMATLFPQPIEVVGVMNTSRFYLCTFSILAILLLNRSAVAVDGFTEPYQTVQVASPEAGIIRQILVEEGQQVDQGAPLVQLDVDLQEAQLAIAAAGKSARGRLDAAQAELAVRQQRLLAIESLHDAGHARQEELDRAQADLAIARGQLTAARETQELKQLEYEKIQVQIQRRTVRAPLAGVVTSLVKRAGEFTAPNDPQLVVLVQLDPLQVTFDVVGEHAKQFAVGDTATVRLAESDTSVDGEVEYVSPVVDAESGTIAVRVTIPNSDGQLQSGQACTLDVP